MTDQQTPEERHPVLATAARFVPLVIAGLVLAAVIGIAGIGRDVDLGQSQADKRAENLARANHALSLKNAALIEVNRQLQISNCRQGVVVYTITQSRSFIVRALIDAGIIPASASRDAERANALIPLRNCEASVATGHIVLLTDEQSRRVLDSVLNDHKLPVFDADGRQVDTLPLPLGVEPDE